MQRYVAGHEGALALDELAHAQHEQIERLGNFADLARRGAGRHRWTAFNGIGLGHLGGQFGQRPADPADGDPPQQQGQGIAQQQESTHAAEQAGFDGRHGGNVQRNEQAGFAQGYRARQMFPALKLHVGRRAGGEAAQVGGNLIIGVRPQPVALEPAPTHQRNARVVLIGLLELGQLGHQALVQQFAAVKAEPKLAKMALVTSFRLSVQPVTDAEWEAVLALAKAPEDGPADRPAKAKPARRAAKRKD